MLTLSLKFAGAWNAAKTRPASAIADEVLKRDRKVDYHP
jgi:hypothetical protein